MDETNFNNFNILSKYSDNLFNCYNNNIQTYNYYNLYFQDNKKILRYFISFDILYITNLYQNL